MIDTGAPRNVLGHVVSGTLASAAIAGGMQYNQVQKGTLGKKEAIHATLKLSLQGGVATGAAIAATNHLGKSNFFGALSALSLGIAGVYAIEKISEQLQEKDSCESLEAQQ
ncbi:hypothetical protein JWV37_06460 [Sulfurospirillum sp. T05]|uniref:Uncharacterized protein n=1 Tax=Sulfurospirillum tamanense TaxID=2813362 RepID=A0ABS2WS17_9BACT|nr:hypothetical protein [Sulfurospirillum tamanensis]MBN2964416.1 hypothetical protein [Sulfurospirillum tamanensis]